MRITLSLLVTTALTPALFGQSIGGVTRYCASGAQGARLTATGSADFAVNGGSGNLELHATGLPSSTVGVFLMGGVSLPATSVGDGLLCVGGAAGLYRLDVVSTGAGGTTISTALDYLDPPVSAATITPGSTWAFQAWFRSGATSDLTDALRIEFVPPQPVSTWTVIAESPRSNHPLGQSFTGGVVVIDTLAELEATWALHTQGVSPPPPLPPVDMNHSTVVAAFTGRRFTLGYSMAVTGIDASVATLDVATEEMQPGSNCGTLPSESQPVQFVAIRKVDGAVLGQWSPTQTTYDCP